MTRTKLYLDLDGVFADFDGHFHNCFGLQTSEVNESQLWSMIDGSHTMFWGGLPLKEGAMDMWSHFSRHEPTFLTGVPKSRTDEVISHKQSFVRRYFPNTPVITCWSRDKQTHMSSPGDVLLDDRKDNCKRWEKAGGRAVFYRDYLQAIQDVNAIMLAT